MAFVYEAHDPNLGRHVAIKTIRVDQRSEEEAAEFEARFRAEARAGGRLQHPNIIGVYDAGRDQGIAYMVMELVHGGDLKQQLDQGTRLTFDIALNDPERWIARIVRTRLCGRRSVHRATYSRETERLRAEAVAAAAAAPAADPDRR